MNTPEISDNLKLAAQSIPEAGWQDDFIMILDSYYLAEGEEKCWRERLTLGEEISWKSPPESEELIDLLNQAKWIIISRGLEERIIRRELEDELDRRNEYYREG